MSMYMLFFLVVTACALVWHYYDTLSKKCEDCADDAGQLSPMGSYIIRVKHCVGFLNILSWIIVVTILLGCILNNN